jgi:DNA polymerase-3 subunit delta'
VFEQISGQEQAKAYFARALERGLSHAYLLAGQPGLGKADFARDLGAALVAGCEGYGDCSSCAQGCSDERRQQARAQREQARQGLHPDLNIIEREGELIRLDQIDRLVAELALKPFAAERRVWLILEADKLNSQAANKLHKSLEEPPPYVYFVLVSDDQQRVLPTIVSRCQVIEFAPLSDEEVEQYVEQSFGLSGDRAAACARLAHGSVERAARLCRDEGGSQESRRSRYLRLAASIAAGDRDAEWSFLEAIEADKQAAEAEIEERVAKRVSELERSVADQKDLERLSLRLRDEAKRRDKVRALRQASLEAIDYLISWLRDLWVTACGVPQAVWNQDRRDELAAGSVARPERYADLLELVVATRKDLSLNIDSRLAMQAMFTRFQEVTTRA